MSPTTHKLHTTQNELNKHNNKTKRSLHIRQKQPKEHLPDYPPVQKTCIPRCKLDGCIALSLNHRQLLYYEHHYASKDEQFIFQSQNMDRQGDLWKYTLPFEGRKLHVCLKTFITTLRITSSSLMRLQKKVRQNECFPRDGRGLHNTRPNQIPDADRKLVKEHLDTYPRVENHYGRMHFGPDQEFLETHLTKREIYNVFCNTYGKRMSETVWREEFKKTGLKIASSRMDTCDECDRLQRKIESFEEEDPERAEYEEQKLAHTEKARRTLLQRQQDIERAKSDPNLFVLSIDIQQTFTTPQLTNSSAHFSRKFLTHYLCIYDEKQKEASLFLWHETDAKVGADDVASCLLKYLQTNFEPLENGKERELIVWSDRCTGQNNNFHHLLLYLSVVHNLKYFSAIKQKFFVSGHSFMSCDRVFGVIEKTLRKINVTDPSRYPALLANINERKPYKVYKMNIDDFYKISYIKSRVRRPRNLKVRDFLVFSISLDQGNSFRGYRSHDVEEIVETFRLNFDLPNIPSPMSKKKYEAPQQLKPKKIQNLTNLLQFIKQEERLFWLDVLNLPHNYDPLLAVAARRRNARAIVDEGDNVAMEEPENNAAIGEENDGNGDNANGEEIAGGEQEQGAMELEEEDLLNRMEQDNDQQQFDDNTDEEDDETEEDTDEELSDGTDDKTTDEE